MYFYAVSLEDGELGDLALGELIASFEFVTFSLNRGL